MRWCRITIPLVFLLLPAMAAASSSGQFVYKKLYSMGTVYEIVAYSPSINRASQAIDAAFQEITALDHMMSNYDLQSDLSCLNRKAHFHAVRVPPDLFQIIQDSLVYSQASDGKYDVTVAPLVDAWKSAIRGGEIPSAARINALRDCIGYRKVQLFPKDLVEFHSPCLRIDLGSIAKGYAVDRAAAILRSRDIQSALINAGGSTLYGIGSPPGRAGWNIRLRDPTGRVEPEVILRNNSVSTSEQGKESLIEASRIGHLIDPITGNPVRSDFAVSVVAKTATATDGLSTTLFLMGPEDGAQLVRQLPDVAAIWVSPAGQAKMASTGPRIRLLTQRGNH